jgi:hypothetical protein
MVGHELNNILGRCTLNPVGVGIPNDSRGQSTGNRIVGNYLYNGRNLGIGSRVRESTYVANNVMVLRVMLPF